MALPVLHIGNKNYSSWSMRPWLALKWAGIAFEEKLLLLGGEGYGRAAIKEVVAVSPSGRVPALHVDGAVIPESLAICEWAAERAPSLWPSDPLQRAEARAAASEMHAGFVALRMAMSMNLRRRVGPEPKWNAATRADLERLYALWGGLRAKYGDEGPWLFGKRSIADAMFAPVATRLRTYNVSGAPDVVQAYCATVFDDAAFKEWEAAALAETAVLAQTDALYSSSAPSADGDANPWTSALSGVRAFFSKPGPAPAKPPQTFGEQVRAVLVQRRRETAVVGGLLVALIAGAAIFSQGADHRGVMSEIARAERQDQEKARVAGESSDQFLAQVRAQPGVEALPSGLLIERRTRGPNQRLPRPTADAIVLVHYEGKLADGTVFDSSFRRGQPAQFSLGEVVSGFREAIEQMRPGDEIVATMPASIAYGAEGMPPVIPPNAALQFRLQLIAFQGADGHIYPEQR
ncbi:FKBP-type peptidyl-prolyl cis-trans isomerase [Terricaulis sp.]|uniref:FKBP-type peptidyl-prolyl cis-trans isomerase n=1 Tax=Terricaulis sp. TaxID=2768686 RepID=UPI003784C5ED